MKIFNSYAFVYFFASDVIPFICIFFRLSPATTSDAKTLTFVDGHSRRLPNLLHHCDSEKLCGWHAASGGGEARGKLVSKVKKKTLLGGGD